ncbi:NAD-dependent epimerase [Macrococcus hajekii]|uniref:NAD-dependent epimerase n=1 Tax=Macrococcus hajekii TaxID=198482 RepID=A0A4R6BNE3_9STAP|nr:NAD-dependent epimerase [Macrococcus hajekii]TDM03370.1 NAD-dependent epimerase [Macrococcus hajekii]GGA98294.1 NAD-dependent epimerase [Macrococcus hajekii]
MKKILITGTAGFIGSNLASKLVNKGYDVLGIDNINDYYSPQLKKDRIKFLLGENFRNYQVDLQNKKDVQSIFNQEQPEIVINLAAQAGVRYSLENPDVYIDSNINGFLNILEGCRSVNCEHLIYASSSSVYGSNKNLPFKTSDNVDHPISLYAATKKSNELMAHTYSHLFNIPTTGLRFFTVYGPWGRPDMALFKFTESILNHKPIDVYNNGNMMRDFTYVDDIVEAISRLIEKAPHKQNPNRTFAPNESHAPYKIYNIGNNAPVKLESFIDAIENATGIKAIKNYMELQPGDVPQTYADVSDLFETIDFKPNTTIQSGVNRFVEWYMEYFKSDLKKAKHNEK